MEHIEVPGRDEVLVILKYDTPWGQTFASSRKYVGFGSDHPIEIRDVNDQLLRLDPK